MKVLALSDEVNRLIHSPSLEKHIGNVDLIVGCGDLPESYLEFVVSILNVPLVYVPGNHDPDRYVIPGGENIDGRVVEKNGIMIAGLGGSIRYKSDGRHQYTDWEMRFRVWMLITTVLMRAKGKRGLDLLITHAPPLGIHDGMDPAHIGFSSFHLLLKALKPAAMLHGHMHILPNIHRSWTAHYSTEVINVFPYRVIDIPTGSKPARP